MTVIMRIKHGESGRSPAHHTIADAYSITPTKSPVDGTVISSRAKLREHNARNEVADVGNDDAYRRGPDKPKWDSTITREHFVESLQKLDG